MAAGADARAQPIGLKALCPPLMLIGTIRLRTCTVWKAGAVVKVDLATHEAVEVVGEIPIARLVERSVWWPENSVRLTGRVDEASWQQLRFRRKTVCDTRGPVHAATRAWRIPPHL